MPARVKLCAIARNEGAYLADWVFHHLHFGFDAIEVWLNGTEDTSSQLLAAITAGHPQVTRRNADELMARCLDAGENFQQAAYARMAKRARRQGFTHAAFLDLDEYWTPRDLTSPIHAFVPDDDDVNVVSFPWAVDVADVSRAPFAPPLSGIERIQLDRHVKSVVRLDDSVRKIRTHTARTRRGRRLLVRDPFPIEDLKAQRDGSFVPLPHLRAHGGELPEAFVLHEVHRSPLEYVASLAKGHRQTGRDTAFKANRLGYLPSDAPVLTVTPSAEYAEERDRFRRESGVEPLVREAEALVRARGEALLRDVEHDPALLDLLRGALRGIAAPGLDAAHPGWAVAVTSVLDTVGADQAVGWAFREPPGPLELVLRGPDGAETVPPVTWFARPEVAEHHPRAPEECGFRVDLTGVDPAAGSVLAIRPPGSAHGAEHPLAHASVA